MKKIFILTIFGVLLASAAHAAILTVEPAVGPAAQADQVVISINTQGESINAIEAHLTFNSQEFSITSVSDGSSIVDLWVEPPTFSNSSGTLDLSGIIPGGITTASGTVLTLTLAPSQSGSSQGFTVASAQALLNDGKGTPAELSIVSEPLALASTASQSSSTTVDTQAPDPFTPEIATDPNIYGGKYFLVFATTDQQSGIDHYEVLEVPAGQKISNTAQWQLATSPYLLTDQALSSDIYVRAVDKAGNLRLVKLQAEHPSGSLPWPTILTIGLGILLLGLLWFLWHKKLRSRE